MTTASTTNSPSAPVIALEEHFMHSSLSDHFPAAALAHPASISDRLFDLMGLRIQEMDEAGIDRQVLSHQSPGSQRLPSDIAVSVCEVHSMRYSQFSFRNMCLYTLLILFSYPLALAKANI
jgi:hypothetical protein